MGGGKGETAPFCPINRNRNPLEMESTHEPREAAWAARFAACLQETLNRNQDTAEAGGEKLESPAYDKQDDNQST
jgi:hypothetical protein